MKTRHVIGAIFGLCVVAVICAGWMAFNFLTTGEFWPERTE